MQTAQRSIIHIQKKRTELTEGSPSWDQSKKYLPIWPMANPERANVMTAMTKKVG